MDSDDYVKFMSAFFEESFFDGFEEGAAAGFFQAFDRAFASVLQKER